MADKWGLRLWQTNYDSGRGQCAKLELGMETCLVSKDGSFKTIDMFLSNEGGFDGIRGQSLQALQGSGVRFLLHHVLDEIDNECGHHDVLEQAL